MNEHSKYKISDELISKFLYGDITKQELDFILDAIEDEQEYRNLLETKNMLDEVHASDILATVDENASLNRLYDKIRDKTNKQPIPLQRKQAHVLGIIVKVAAIIVVLLGVSVFWYYNIKPEEVILASAQESITDVVLPDSSVIDINKNTKLVYPDKFTGKKREVKLISGEAYFDVAKQENKTFTVKTEHIDVQVLGTEFNVTLDKENGETEVIVQEGSVRIKFKAQDGKTLDPVIITAGNKCVFTQSTYTIDTVSKPNQNELAWKTGVFVFNDTPMLEALTIVAEEFKYELHIEDGAVRNCSISAVINNTKLTSILKAFEISMNIETHIEEKMVYIFGEGCEQLE